MNSFLSFISVIMNGNVNRVYKNHNNNNNNPAIINLMAIITNRQQVEDRKGCFFFYFILFSEKGICTFNGFGVLCLKGSTPTRQLFSCSC